MKHQGDQGLSKEDHCKLYIHRVAEERSMKDTNVFCITQQLIS